MLPSRITRFTALSLLTIALVACSSADPGASLPPTAYPFITATPQSQPTVLSPSEPPSQPSPPPQVDTPLASAAAPATAAPTALVITATIRPGVGCRYAPLGLFAKVYQADPGLPPSLGCAVGHTSGERPRQWPVTIEFQPFERGYMLWVSSLGWVKGKAVYAMLDDDTFSRYDDTFDPATDLSSSSTISPPPGLYQPVDALGKIWRTQPGLSTRLGYARAPSTRADTTMMMFEYGQMIDISSAQQVLVLKQGQPGSWSLHAGN